jgi:hypothetical protein
MTLSLVAATVLAVTAHAHVAPSVDDNNRYLKVTPMKGGFRLAYTVFFGEVPGAQERRIVDGNHDGTIDDGEAKRFADKLASEVAASLVLELPYAQSGQTGSGETIPITWSVTDAGFGSGRSVSAGAFSVDMIAYICAPSGRLRLRDTFRIPRPGETEVVVEDAPNVNVTEARVGSADDPRRDWRFLGAGGPLSDDGVTVAWTAGPTAPVVPAACAKPARSSAPSLPVRWLGVAAGALVLVGMIAMWMARRRRTRV